MANVVIGYESLQRRFAALGSQGSASLMGQLGIAAVHEAKALVPRKTGNLARSIGVASRTPVSVTVLAGANYAEYVEKGTKPHEITPRARKALRWAASAGGARLTGTPRKGAAVVFATRVHHPGTKPHPFLVPGAKQAVALAGAATIVKIWNEAK